MSEVIGKPIDRVDGRLKVTGGARFSAEHSPDRIAYAVIIPSTIASGRVRSIDTTAAEKVPGVIKIFTHTNAPKLKKPAAFMEGGGAPESRVPLQDANIYHDGQPIGLVVADSFERATEAAMRVKVSYQKETPRLDMAREKVLIPKPGFGGPPDKKHGDPDAAMLSAAVKIDAEYSTPTEHHNPMEPHATTAVWSGNDLLVWDSNQYISGLQKSLATAFGIKPENVRVLSPFVGGGFGTKALTWAHQTLAAMAARAVRRPVKLVLSRKQMYRSTGFRPETHQHVVLGAESSGKLVSIIHEGTNPTSMNDEYTESVTGMAGMMYAAPHRRISQRVVRLNVGLPTFQRAPGEAPGSFALESAMDELAWKLGIDPIDLRNMNDTDVDPENGKPWSSKSLRQCFEQGAARFGWARRTREPRSMRDGRYLVGMGVAAATFPSFRLPASARIVLFADGRAHVTSGGQEMGMGTATVMTQLAADGLGIPVERVRFELGDTNFPPAWAAGGSSQTGSVGSAVKGATDAMREKVLALIKDDAASPLRGLSADEITFADGRLHRAGNTSAGESYSDILRRHYMEQLDVRFDAVPERDSKYSSHAFGAQFAEVRVDPDLGEVRVSRWVAAFGAGKILNAKTARSQFIGGVVWGIGMALQEHTNMDPNLGRYTNANIAEYLVPVNLDVPEIDIIMLDEKDPHVNPIGTKGIGEVGIVGAAAAIANAVYHATGKRVRDLPITVEKLL